MQSSDVQIISDLGQSLSDMMSKTTQTAAYETSFDNLFQQAAAERAAAGF